MMKILTEHGSGHQAAVKGLAVRSGFWLRQRGWKEGAGGGVTRQTGIGQEPKWLAASGLGGRRSWLEQRERQGHRVTDRPFGLARWPYEHAEHSTVDDCVCEEDLGLREGVRDSEQQQLTCTT